MTIGFYLKDAKSVQETMVYITATTGGKRIKRSTGVRVKPTQWNNNKVRPLAPEAELKNLKIENLINTFKDIERDYLLKKEILTKEILETEFDNRIGGKSVVKSKKLLDVFDIFIESKHVAETTLKTYRTCLKHLKEFSNQFEKELSFEDVNLSFNDDLMGYFYEKKFINSTIGKYVKVFKTFMEWALERNYHSNLDFKKFEILTEDSEKIILKPEIVEKLRTTDFQNDYKNAVRDIFILSCYTGLRFIDIQNLTEKDVQDDFLRIHIQKTRETLEIPLLGIPKEIIKNHIERYGHLKVPANQYCNREIKELFKEIEFTDKVKFTKHSGKKNIVVEKEACDFLTMHYGRVFFITNSLRLKMNEEFIRKITGHKDYKSFKRYINFSREMVSDSLKSAWE